MRERLLVAIWLVVLIGCGGAGGGVAGGGSGDAMATPVANAGEDLVVIVNSAVFLHGGDSRHADGYHWTLTELPEGSTAIVDGAYQIDPTFIPDRCGWYEIRLVVNNGFVNSDPDHIMLLAVLDDFDRADIENLSFSPDWFNIEDFEDGPDVGEFQIFDKIAYPTNDEVNINLWSASFTQNQEAFFTIKAKPTDANTSSLGVFLRVDDEAQTGYLVTFVPQSGLDDDTIRVWKLVDSRGTKICEFSYEFYADDQIWVRAVDNAISVFVDSYAIIAFDNPIGACYDNASPYLRGGYIGIYAAKDSGALDDFGGGEIGP